MCHSRYQERLFLSKFEACDIDQSVGGTQWSCMKACPQGSGCQQILDGDQLVMGIGWNNTSETQMLNVWCIYMCLPTLSYIYLQNYPNVGT